MPTKIDEPKLKNFHDRYKLYIINPEVVQEQTCEKLKSDFGLSDDEAKNYFNMIKDEYTIDDLNEEIKLFMGGEL